MINEEINGSVPSTPTNPTSSVSDVIIPSSGKGQIFLQVEQPDGEWENITNQTGCFPVSTSDLTLSYRFKPSALKEPVRVYFQ